MVAKSVCSMNRLFAFWLSGVCCASALSVADLGLPADGTRNATPYVRRALAELSGGGTLVFPKGIYHFDLDGTETVEPYVSNNQDDFPKWLAMPVRGMRNLTIDGAARCSFSTTG